MTDDSATAAARTPLAAVGALCAVQFVDVMGVTVTITALPAILRDLDAGGAAGTAVVTSYAMVFGGLLMVGSRAGDRWGHHRVLLWSLALFALASVVATLSPGALLLAVARGLQGAAAAASVPSALRLITSVTSEGAPRRRAVAGWSAAGATAGGAGFVVGGLLTEVVSWRAVFGLNVVLAAVLAVVLVRAVPRDDPVEPRPRVPVGRGLLLSSAAMAAVLGPTLLGESRVPSAGMVAGAVVLLAAPVLGALFLRAERDSHDRLVPSVASRSPDVRWGNSASFLNTATTSSTITVATLYLQDELGLSAVRAAAVLLSLSLFVVVGSSVAAAVVDRRGWSTTVAVGLAVVAAGNLLFAVVPTVAGIAAGSAACGLGLGLASVAATDMGTSVAVSARSAAAGLVNTSAQLGTAIGTALVLVLARLTDPRTAWVVVATAGLLAAVAAFRAHRSPP